MALKGIQITLVTSTATPLLVKGAGTTQVVNSIGNIGDPIPIIIQNLDAALNMWIGGPNVDATHGILLGPGQSLPMNLYGESEIPYVFAVGTPIVAVLVGRQ